MSQIRNHKFIICGGDGLNPLGIIRSLGKEGIHSYVISSEQSDQRPLIAASKYVEKVIYTNSCLSTIDVLINVFGNEPYKPFVFITDEGTAEILDQKYDEICGKFYFYDAGKKGKLTELINKSTQCQLAQDCGLTIPKFKVTEKGRIPEGLDYPVITKTITPNEGLWKKDMFVCNNEDDLQSAFKHIKANRLIIEEYINGIYEYDIKGISIERGREVIFTYAKKWNCKEDAFGSMMHFSPMTDSILKLRIKEMMQRAEYSGIFDVEFIQDANGNLFFLEVNWRTGMYTSNHTFNGFNLPLLWAESTLNGHIDSSSIHPIYEHYSSIDEIAAFSSCLRKPKLIGAWIRELRHSTVLYYFDRSDIKPCILAWMRFFGRKWKSLFRHKDL